MKTKIKLTREQKKALENYEYALKQEDRLAGSVFANPFTMRKQEEKTRIAYEACKRLGMTWEHGL